MKYALFAISPLQDGLPYQKEISLPFAQSREQAVSVARFVLSEVSSLYCRVHVREKKDWGDDSDWRTFCSLATDWTRKELPWHKEEEWGSLENPASHD